MYFDNYDLITSVGIKDIKIGMSLKAVEEILKNSKIPYKKEVDNHKNTDRTP